MRVALRELGRDEQARRRTEVREPVVGWVGEAVDARGVGIDGGPQVAAQPSLEPDLAGGLALEEPADRAVLGDVDGREVPAARTERGDVLAVLGDVENRAEADERASLAA